MLPCGKHVPGKPDDRHVQLTPSKSIFNVFLSIPADFGCLHFTGGCVPWIPTSAPLPGQGMEGKWCKFLGAWGSSQDCPSRGLWVWGEVNGFLWVPGSRHLSRVCLWSSVDIYQTCHLLRILRGPCQAPHVAVQVPEDSHVSQCELGCLLGPFVPLP